MTEQVFYTTDLITSGSLAFDDGSVISFGTLANDGSGYGLNIGNKTVSSLLVRVGSVSAKSANIGLSEIAVYGTALNTNSTIGGDNNSTIGVNGTDITNSTIPVGGSTSFAWADDIALFASASASSAAPNQGASQAIDGKLGGYTPNGGDYTQEWASNGEGAGATLTLSWTQPVNIRGILLYDRPNTNVRTRIPTSRICLMD